jgi:hypothetical protein
MSKRLTIAFRVLPDGQMLTATGRDAWALSQLQSAGERGVTPIEVPGPRWSAYIFNLRAMGLLIGTLHEKHSGKFPGTHGRYVLRSQIEILEGADA